MYKVIRRRYQNYFEDEQFQMLVFENDVVTLDLPATPPKVVDSWKILPLTYPQVISNVNQITYMYYLFAVS